MNELRQIIFVDSYARGRVTDIRVDGGFHVNGENGAGKTSLLRVTPLFYGASPAAIARRSSNGNQSFVDYYLPRDTSYIVFEYLKDGEPKLSVVSRSGDRLVFRLADGPYDDELFLQGDPPHLNVIPSGHWNLHAKALGRHPTERINQDLYRQIILVNTRAPVAHLGRDRASFVNQSRVRFSLCDRNTKAENIEKVAVSVLERSPSVVTIRKVLAEIIRQTVPELTSALDGLSGKSLQSLQSQLKAFSVMRGQEDQAESMLQARLGYEGSLQRMAELRKTAERCLELLERLIQDLSSQEERARTTEQEAVDRQRRQEDIFRRKEDALRRDKDRLQETLKELDKDQRRFERENAEKAVELSRALPDIDSQLQARKKEYDSLVGENADIDWEYERLIIGRREEHRDHLAALERERSDRRVGFGQEKTALSDRRTCDLDAAQVAHNEMRESIQSRLGELKEGVARFQALVDAVVPPEDEQKKLEQARQRLDELSTSQGDSRQEEVEAVEALRQQQDGEKANAREAVDIRREIENDRSEKKRIRLLKDAPRGSLLAFLRERVPDWTVTIGKVAPESLLMRTDLSPSLREASESSALSFYGVNIELERLECSIHGEEKLLEIIARVDEAIVEAESRLQVCERRGASLAKAIRKAEARVAKAGADRRAIDTAMDEQRRNVSFVQSRMNQWVEEEKGDRRRVLKGLKDEVEVVEEELRGEKDRFSREKKAIQVEHDRKNKVISDKIVALESTFADRREQAIQAHDKDVDGLKRQKLAALKQRGVDGQTLTALSAAIDSLQADRKAAREAGALAEEYHRWQRTQLPKRELWTSELREVVEKLSQEQSAWRLESRELGEAVRVAGEELKRIRRLLSEQSEERDEIESLLHRRLSDERILDRLTSAVLDKDALGLATAAYLKERAVRAMDTLRESERLGRAAFSAIKRAMSPYLGTMPHDYILSLEREARATTDDLNSTWLHVAEGVSEYFQNALESNEGLIVDQVSLEGARINDYFQHLQQIDDEIRKVSRDLNGSVASIIEEFDFFRDYRVYTRSRIDSLDFWDPLRRFSEAYQRWASRDDGEAPGEQLMERLAQVGRILETSRLDQSVNLESSFEIEVVVEDPQGRKRARTDAEWKDLSSNGLSYLAIILLYTALVRILRGGANIRLIWAVDELVSFSQANIKKVSQFLDQNGIDIASACPDYSVDIHELFQHNYEVEIGTRQIKRFEDRPPQEGLDDWIHGDAQGVEEDTHA
ncbi:ATP-binding protein [Guyparkeria sp. 1SP6A2]|nr:ATP-binding protein [Guyparkeria sp. 1SP6A2]